MSCRPPSPTHMFGRAPSRGRGSSLALDPFAKSMSKTLLACLSPSELACRENLRLSMMAQARALGAEHAVVDGSPRDAVGHGLEIQWPMKDLLEPWGKTARSLLGVWFQPPHPARGSMALLRILPTPFVNALACMALMLLARACSTGSVGG